MRVLYYAMGGGLGHLVRARAVLHTLGLETGAALLSAAPQARDRRVAGPLEIVHAPLALDRDTAAWRAWLLACVNERRPDVVCIDAFPAGLLGELCDLAPLPCALWHVARLLHWPAYAPFVRGVAPRFERVLRVEPLAPAQQAWLDAHAAVCEDLTLIDPPYPYLELPPAARVPHWLVVHSGPAHEVAELVAYAHEARTIEHCELPLLVVTGHAPPTLPPDTHVIDAFPATPFFAGASRIFSAAGFNVVRQAAAFRAQHVLLPQPRRFDDQFERARRVRAAGAISGV